MRILIIVFFGLSSALQAVAGSKTIEYRIAGFTQHLTNGRIEKGQLIGIPAMNAHCRKEFGAMAKASTISEAMFMTNGQSKDLGTEIGAWLAPGNTMVAKLVEDVFVPVDSIYGKDVGVFRADAWNALKFAYCGGYGYNSDSFRGPVALWSRVDARSCDQLLRIACSMPVKIEVP